MVTSKRLPKTKGKSELPTNPKKPLIVKPETSSELSPLENAKSFVAKNKGKNDPQSASTNCMSITSSAKKVIKADEKNTKAKRLLNQQLNEEDPTIDNIEGVTSSKDDNNDPSTPNNTLKQRSIVEYNQNSIAASHTQMSTHNEMTNVSAVSTVLDEILTSNVEIDDSIQYDAAIANITGQHNLSDSSIGTSRTGGSQHMANSMQMSSKHIKSNRGSKIQNNIKKLIHICNTEILHLDDKIKLLESQYFKQGPEVTALVKRFDSGLGDVGNIHLYPGQKSRKNAQQRLKAIQNTSQALITEHIFSLTSSTCTVSKELLNN
ncbi:hypothetical protein BdWA1_002653 [Babesia duncani]|uniref:Uncharacterized protein n=1 Tax=Babesia duncani TaxID=323732 RepID=A0AAD9PJW3_9APIC|nr:hypothetical protein BdWA1_002653 [Babesia duncani]